MVGEFKDDQLQSHHHHIQTFQNAGTSPSIGRLVVNGTDPRFFDTGTPFDAREGDVTRGKHKGVRFIIKVL